MKTILSLIILLFTFSNVNAQIPIYFNIPIKYFTPGRTMTGYYHPGANQIIIDIENKDTIVHSFYDTAFNLQKEYSVVTNRTLAHSKKNPCFVKNISVQNSVFEIYANDDSIFIYRLDINNGIDACVALIDLTKYYKDEKLSAVIPNENGCLFLTASAKNKKALIHRWDRTSNKITLEEIALPKSTLPNEVIKERGDYLEIKYKNLFSDPSVSQISKPEIFQFPSQSQLFYNDSCIYIINKMAYEIGINVFKININQATATSTNYFINKRMEDTQSKFLTFPVATIYDSLLIIQNCSMKVFEYYFYNLNSGELISKYETIPDNSLYSLVHSPLRQIGTFTSRSKEVEVDNEKAFMRTRNKGFIFIKPVLSNDSLILTFGSFVPTEGVEGMLLNMATMGLGSAFRAGTVLLIPYLTTQRNMFLYAHSKFSLQTLKPSTANNVKTYLDDFAADNKMRDLSNDNSILIEMPGKLYISMYNKKTKLFDVSSYKK